MLRDVAVVQEVAGTLLHAAGAALDLEVVRLTGADRLGVEPLRCGEGDRGLVETGVAVVERRVGVRVGAPPVAAAVEVEDVEHLGPGVDEADLGGVAEVPAGDRGRRIAPCIGVVGERLEPVLRIHAKAMHERLAAVVQRARAGAVGRGDRVLHGERFHQLARLQRHVRRGRRDAVRLVADLVMQQVALAERLAGARHDRRLPAPAGLKRLPGVGVQVDAALRLDRQHAEKAVRHGVTVAWARADVVGALELGVLRDVVPVLRGAVGRDGRRYVVADGVAGGGDIEREAVDVDTELTGRLVLEADLDTVT